MAVRPHGAKDEGAQRSASNAELLEGVLARHEPKLRRQAALNSQRPVDAEDALQEAYALFLQHYDGRWPALPYLFTTIKRCAWQISRRASRRRELSPDVLLGPDTDGVDPWELLPHASPEPEEATARRETIRQRRALLAQLKPDEQRALFLLGLGFSTPRSWSSTRGRTRR